MYNIWYYLYCIRLYLFIFIRSMFCLDDWKSNREVLLHVKRERVRVTSDSGAQIRYTSRSCTLLGFATRRDVSADKQAHRYQQMTRQQPIEHICKQKWMYAAKAQGRGDCRLQLSVIFSSVFAFISHWDGHVMTLRELTGYTWKSWRVTCSLPWTMLQRTQVLMTSHR